MGDPKENDFTRIIIDLHPEAVKEVLKIVKNHGY
jgi:hypothetical protein